MHSDLQANYVRRQALVSVHLIECLALFRT